MWGKLKMHVIGYEIIGKTLKHYVHILVFNFNCTRAIGKCFRLVINAITKFIVFLCIKMYSQNW